MQKGHSDTITDGIRIRVGAHFLPAQSEPDEGLYTYTYRVIITNEGREPARLLSRHWVITDAHGDVQEVKGAGVVGAQPRLAPGESFEYMSGCPLPTEWGTMEGTYQMERDDGRSFEVKIGRFFLAPNVAPLITP